MSAASYLKAKYWGADYPPVTIQAITRTEQGQILLRTSDGATLPLDRHLDAYEPLTPEEEAEEMRKEAEQQALVDRNRPEEYDRWPGREGWVGNDE